MLLMIMMYRTQLGGLVESHTKEDSPSAAITREDLWKPQVMPSFKWMAFQNGTNVDMMTTWTDLTLDRQITIPGQC